MDSSNQDSSNLRYPTEDPEGIIDQRTEDGSLISTGAVSISRLEVMDLISEGEIEGLVSGEWEFSGNIGDLGWSGASFKFYSGAQFSSDPISSYDFTEGTSWLRSIYWNNTPLINSNGKYNFQEIKVAKTNGYPNGELLSLNNTNELRISRPINERLRGTSLNADGNPSSSEDDYIKTYRILNPECIGVLVNIRLDQLYKVIQQGDRAGDTIRSNINYRILYKPIFSSVGKTPQTYNLGASENLKGRISFGFIKSTRVDFFVNEKVEDRDFLGWEIQIVRTTPDSLSTHLRNETYVDSITEIYQDSYSYPNSAIISTLFDAEYFSQVPDRSYDVKLLKVKIPSNYNPITKTYDESSNGWDGTFKEEKYWTDNPAWCFYDLIINDRYGLGRYIPEQYTDKWTLYEIGKYCDVLVPDGFGGVEPRFRSNVYLNSREEAIEVLNNMASIFRSIIYYNVGSIYTVQDSKKDPLWIFTNSNVVDGDFEYASSSQKARHTVAVIRFNDEKNLYKPTIEYVENHEGIRRYGIREIDLTAFGVTSRGQAKRLGEWILLTENSETETISFNAGFEGAYLRPGDIFSVYDENRKIKNYEGRLFRIQNFANSGIATLDKEINIGYETQCELKLLTPSFYYDPSNITGLNSQDYGEIRRPAIQTVPFSGGDITSINGRSQISFSSGLNTTDYTATGNLIWTVSLREGANSTAESLQFLDSGFDYYRVINISENENKGYSVNGLLYNVSKFATIESGLSFDRNTQEYKITPEGPRSMSVTVAPLSTPPLTRAQETLQKEIDYSFIITNYSGISNYRVYANSGNFLFTNGNLPPDSMLINVLPANITYGTYVPEATGIYLFRVYAYNEEANLYSNSFVSGSGIIENVSTIENIIISSLRLTNSESSNLYDNILGVSRNSGYYTAANPEFAWDVGAKDGPIPNDITYRFSVREPSHDNIPSANIYFEETGINNPNLLYQFLFTDNKISVGGPYREYDVVVEAMDQYGYTSAGNTVGAIPIEPNWSSNPLGYDILYVNNSLPDAPVLTPSNNEDINGNHTRQSIYTDGTLAMTYIAPDLTGDIRGVYVYSSTGEFVAQDVIDKAPHIKYNFQTFESSPSAPLRIFAPDVFGEYTIGYIGIAFYDIFDQEYKNQGWDISTGLNISNIIPLISSGRLRNVDGDRITVGTEEGGGYYNTGFEILRPLSGPSTYNDDDVLVGSSASPWRASIQNAQMTSTEGGMEIFYNISKYKTSDGNEFIISSKKIVSGSF